MVSSPARTVAQYLASLPPDRRKVISAVRRTIRAHLPAGFRETMNWGMISYEIPLKRYPDTYNGQPLMYAALAAQKNNYALYLTCAYQDKALASWVKAQFAKAGKRLDTGKSCLRFTSLDDLPLDVIGTVIASTTVAAYLAKYERSRRA
ncbi:MAG: DUF1801 domain-containing protein [Gemmatimonadota bacterium]|nr:DUF1801 domain-containing protein [Gemmatimonadota bacterium]